MVRGCGEGYKWYDSGRLFSSSGTLRKRNNTTAGYSQTYPRSGKTVQTRSSLWLIECAQSMCQKSAKRMPVGKVHQILPGVGTPLSV